MKNYLALSLICLATACSSTSTQNDKADQAGVVCTKEAPIGSHMSKKHCTTAAEREKARQQAEETMKTPTENTRAR